MSLQQGTETMESTHIPRDKRHLDDDLRDDNYYEVRSCLCHNCANQPWKLVRPLVTIGVPSDNCERRNIYVCIVNE